MQGSILHFDGEAGSGVIRAEDGNRYRFAASEYRSAGIPAPGVRVDFDVAGDTAIEIYDVPEFAPVPRVAPSAIPAPLVPEPDAQTPYADPEPEERTGPNLKLIGLSIAALIAVVVASWFLFAGAKVNDVNGNTSVAATDEPEGLAKRYYASRNAKVRDKPTVSGSSVLREIKRGEVVSGHLFQGVDATSEWLKLAGREEYVSLANLVETQPLPLIEAINRRLPVADDIDLRNQPDDQAGVISSVKAGQSVEIVGRLANDWIEVALPKGGVAYFRDLNGVLDADDPPEPGFSEARTGADDAPAADPLDGALPPDDKEDVSDGSRKP